MKKRLFSGIIGILSIFMLSSNSFAVPYPHLDFGFNFNWDGSNYSDAFVLTGTATYVDGSMGIDAITNSFVELNLSFDGAQNDTLTIANWFTADIVITSEAFDPVGMTPNPYTAKLDNVVALAPAGTSQWLDEFMASINPAYNYDGQLLLSFMSANPLNDGTYLINGAGKIAPIPEPSTILLLGSGLVGLAFYNRRKKA